MNRWKSFTFLEYSEWATQSWIDIKPHFVAGPQPLPIDFLPRVWDFINPGAAIQSFFNYFGLGVELNPTGSFGRNFKTLIGYYGGQVGGSVALDAKAFQLRAGYWGLTLGPNDVVTAERLWVMTLGARF